MDLVGLKTLFADLQPEAVVNCVGVIKQRGAAHDAATSIRSTLSCPISSRTLLFTRGATHPLQHRLRLQRRRRATTPRTTLPTRRSLWANEVPGEVRDGTRSRSGARSSDESWTTSSRCVEWFLRQRGEVTGFTRAIYTGLTTHQMALIVDRVLVEHPDLSGVYQVASAKITKFDLLLMIQGTFRAARTKSICVPTTAFPATGACGGTGSLATTGIAIPSWQDMIASLADDADRYGSVASCE